MSKGTEATITPVMPPMTNTTKKPTAHRSGVWKRGRPPHSVASHEKTITPEGMAMRTLAAEKKARTTGGSPTVNM